VIGKSHVFLPVTRQTSETVQHTITVISWLIKVGKHQHHRSTPERTPKILARITRGIMLLIINSLHSYLLLCSDYK